MKNTTHGVQTSGGSDEFPVPLSTSGGREFHPAASNGFAQTFGLHPGMALLTFILDIMLFGGELATSGLLIPVSIASSIVLGVVVFMAQKKWYGDESESAFIKALILAGLTAIPTPLPAFLYLPAGVVGLFHRKER